MLNYNDADVMVVAIARYLQGTTNCFHGVASNIPMIAIELAKLTYAPNMDYLNITGGVNVCSIVNEASTDGPDLFQSSKSVFSLTDIFDLSARGALDVAFLSGGQIDQFANINNSVIGKFDHPKVKLPGGAGSAVLIPNVKRAFVWKTKHNLRGFVEKVDFITSSGNVKYVFTPLCIFENVDHHLRLIQRMPNISLETVKSNTGFQILETDVPEMSPPCAKELELLQEIDPLRFRDMEF